MIKYTKLRALAKAAANSDGLLLNMLTVYERAEEGWPPTRLDLSSARVLDLLTRYPTLFAEAWVQPATLASPFARHGFECGPGWFQIIDRLAAKLVLDPNLRVGQMKEEVGLLTVCFEASELARPEIEAFTDAALVEAREESRVACGLCGERGSLAKRDRGYSVRCEPCDNLDDIAHDCGVIADYVSAMDFAAFETSTDKSNAVLYHLMRIGEAASQQTHESRQRHPSIDWARLELLCDEEVQTHMQLKEAWRLAHSEIHALAAALR